MRKSKIFSDPSKIVLDTRTGRNQFIGAIQHAYDQARKAGNKYLNAQAQEFTGSQNFPEQVAAIIQKYSVDVTEIDRGYEQAFDVIDLRNTAASSFKIRDVSSGLTFTKVKEGERAKVHAVSGNVITVEMDLYGGGLQWLRTWFMDQEWWTIQDQALEFRRKWWEDRGIVFYALIQALTNHADQNVVWDTVGATTVAKDINTIVAGILELLIALQSSGLGVNAQTQFVMLCPLAMKTRVERALEGTFSSLNPAGDSVTYTVRPVYTTGLADTDYSTTDGSGTDWVGNATTNKVPLGYLCVPGRKNKIGERMDLTVMAETDILAFAETTVGWGRYGGAISEAQWRRLLGA